MPISLDEVRHVARLARLNLQEEELITFQNELNDLIHHFEDISGLDTSNLTAKPHAVSLNNVWAEDQERPGLTREQALANAPVQRAGLFIVPTIIEE